MRDSLVRLALVVAALAVVPGCGSKTYLAKDFGHAEKSAEEASPTGGPSLDQRRENMTRMYKDLVHFRTSLRDSQERGDRTTSNALGLFIEKADVLMRMNDTSRAAKTLDEIASRYKGRDDMLVHYPMGSESPLGKAIKLLRDGV